MGDIWHSCATVAILIGLIVARGLLYPFSVIFRLLSLWVVFLRTMMAIWIPVAVGLALSTLIGLFLCELHQVVKVILQGTGVISLLMAFVAKRSWNSLQAIVEAIRTLNVLPLPSWEIKKATKDTSYNFKGLPEVARKCLRQSWALGAIAFLVVTSIALGYSEPDRRDCKAMMIAITEYIGSPGDD